jgi:hypothetical protein
MAITRKLEIAVFLNPRELAENFCDMTADQQAEFFNSIAIVRSSWSAPFTLQLNAVSGSKQLAKNGRSIMKMIGEYSEK